MFDFNRYYDVKTFPETVDVAACDTLLLGESHADQSMIARARKIISMNMIPGSVLLIENIPSMQDTNPGLLPDAKKYVDRFLGYQRRCYLEPSVKDVSMLGWDENSMLESRMAAMESLQFCQNFIQQLGETINPIFIWFQSKQYLSSDALVQFPPFISEIQKCIPEDFRNRIFLPHISAISEVWQPKIDQIVGILKQLMALQNSINYEKQKNVDSCACTEEIKEKIRSDMRQLISQGLELLMSLAKDQEELTTAYESRFLDKAFPHRTKAMVDTLKKIHSDETIKKCFLTCGSSHLDEKYAMTLTSEERPLYSLEPLYSYLRECGKKVAVLIPKKK